MGSIHISTGRHLASASTGRQPAHHSGLTAPTITTRGLPVTGHDTPILRRENKRRKLAHLESQLTEPEWWKTYEGKFALPGDLKLVPQPHRNQMCPSGLALLHPAAETLLQYATQGCPVETGTFWTIEQMHAAINRGPHSSALVPEAAAQLDDEVSEKVANKQARLVYWDEICHNPPPNLKISPVAMVPHKSRPFRAILDLSFSLRISPIQMVPSVNSSTTKTAPQRAITQLGHSLNRIIHAFATADDNAVIFMAKWDIKDGFWRLDCQEGEEWNFAYVLPSSVGRRVTLVVPTSLQMGWIESPPYFCTASETARDVAMQYAEIPHGDLLDHKFLPLTQTHTDFQTLPPTSTNSGKYMVEVFMDDYIGLAIPTSQQSLNQVANAIMYGIHDVFPPSTADNMDPISHKKLEKGDGQWANIKEILGLTFDGTTKTLWLSAEKRDVILLTLTKWLRLGRRKGGIRFTEFQTIVAKLHHAFITLPVGKGLMSPFYPILALQPLFVFIHRNKLLVNAITDCRTFLRETVSTPTKCKALVSGWPDIIGITDASAYGAGGVIIGETVEVVPTVFRLQWPIDISRSIVSTTNPQGHITNSDLEMAGLLILWLVIEAVAPSTQHRHVALFSDNSPTVHWVQRLAAKHSETAMQLIRALSLRLKMSNASPLIPLHIAGKNNALTDIPSRSFGLLDRVPPFIRHRYTSDFHLADTGFYCGRVEETTKNRAKYWAHWCAYVAPLGLDPYLQDTTFAYRIRTLTGFAARVRTGAYGRRKQVTVGTVNSAITAIGTTIALATGTNPTKITHSDKLLPRLAQMLTGWEKDDPPVIKKLPVEVDIPEFLVTFGLSAQAGPLDKAIGDLTMIAFYYLLRVGEYTVKSTRNASKQTVQFRLQDITFFKKDSTGVLRPLPRSALYAHLYQSADSATLRLENQKNGWKNVCIHQEANGHPTLCPVRALGRRWAHITTFSNDISLPLSSFYHETMRYDVRDTDIRHSLKQAATILKYQQRNIPIQRIDTHSLRCGGANALALSGYSDTEIQKMGRWRGATFKEYIREQLASFSKGMSTNMKQKFSFVNIEGGVFHDMTPYLLTTPYSQNSTE